MDRLHIEISGIVQGVGFRPFVHKLALRHRLTGWVRNNRVGVEIEVQGQSEELDEFLRSLRGEKPPMAVLDGVKISFTPCLDEEEETEFVIRDSDAEEQSLVLVSPDVGTCSDCVRELTDRTDRRYRYPFINCTQCGPRYTIIKELPYDRKRTTMDMFPMCPECQQEYDNSGSRRFHAQPNACSVCGPEYWLTDRAGKVVPVSDPIEGVRFLMDRGEIIAVKGIGGYHLSCDARKEGAVQQLRQRKGRDAKPLAVMGANLAVLRKICQMSEEEENLLLSPARPIVIVKKNSRYDLAEGVAPGNPYVGVMLPYAPVHHLLLQRNDVWVMTSGNHSDSPVLYNDKEAMQYLKDIADYFLLHNRIIYRRADDSVARIVEKQPYYIRRSRGYAPAPLRMGKDVPPLLACGGELKNTFCLARGPLAFVSPHIGDLENAATYQSYTGLIKDCQQMFAVEPQTVVCDMHPGYLSTQYAKECGLPVMEVQHHHAHIASLLAEWRQDGPVIGVAFDGIGMGTDGNLWGGEFLLADSREFTRMGYFTYFRLPGGSKGIEEPWRVAAWMLKNTLGKKWDKSCAGFARQLPEDWATVMKAAEEGVNSPLCSSAGRLFEAAAALVGIRSRNYFEGQAAMELEWLAGNRPGKVLPFSIGERKVKTIDMGPTFVAMAEDLARGRSAAEVAADFHTTMGEVIWEMVRKVSLDTGVVKVALSGGVFQNIRLLTSLTGRLRDYGFEVLIHRQVPCNDGGLSLGQAWIAGSRLSK